MSRGSGRSKPSDGKARRLLRLFGGKYALSSKEVSKFLRVGQRQAERYLARLHDAGLIYQRYRQYYYIYYSLIRKKI